MTVEILGLDIGGANIKAATADGECLQHSFALWKNPDQLPHRLSSLLQQLRCRPRLVALTMTGELADCFSDRENGVCQILNAVQQVFPSLPIQVWLTSGEFVTPEDANDLTELVAAANWHALATWAGRAVPQGPALLADCGSTTTDLIPLLDGCPIPQGRTDLQRLASSELVYTGVRRTPVCALATNVQLSFNEQDLPHSIPLAGELFATAADIHLLTGNIAEDENDLETADGRPCTQLAARSRLARQLCSDLNEITPAQVLLAAEQIRDSQLHTIAAAITRVIGTLPATQAPLPVLISGSGGWLISQALQHIAGQRRCDIMQLSEMYRRDISTCAPAFAVARLAAERCTDALLPLTPHL